MTPVLQKIAFIHYSKAAGRYVNYYLQQYVFKNTSTVLAEQQVKAFNSWARSFGMARDWTEEELLQLAANRHPGQYPTPEEVRTHHQLWPHDYLARQYVHNHHHNWSPNSILEFLKKDWFTFMFIREPAELLCSLWTWVQKSREESNNSKQFIQPAWLADLSLDRFLKEILQTPDFSGFYALPEYVDKLDYVAEFTEDNFRQFLLDYFDHCYRPEAVGKLQRGASGNPGYSAYRKLGLISDKTDDLLNNNLDVNRVRKRIAP